MFRSKILSLNLDRDNFQNVLGIFVIISHKKGTEARAR